MNPKNKYKSFPVIQMNNREWPNKQITKAPIWCSVDLRDGNQALAVPMDIDKKVEFFKTLVRCGFKEIEVGFPAASQTEFDFVRFLIEENLIPDDVTIQVLVQAREDLIMRTVESLAGAKKAIVHLYNSTSPAQREIVFGMTKSQVVDLAIQGVRWIKKHSENLSETEIILQYSPESFSATEIEFAVEICETVICEWNPTPSKKMIINLPCTVEVAMPNIYADQIEWFCKSISKRDLIVVSIHTHNDRGTGVAATELGILAGADRVEGTLFGNGERTGNLDIITVALNMYTQGIDSKLDFSNLELIRKVYEKCTGMRVYERHPYSGELVFTAFSGSHQDAIRKGLNAKREFWDVPYLVIDPKDIGRQYNEVIRVNGQSGKGGIAYILESECGIFLPKDLIKEFGQIAGKKIDSLNREVDARDLREMFWKEYVNLTNPYSLKYFNSTEHDGVCSCEAGIICNDYVKNISGEGNGPIDAFVQSLRNSNIEIINIIEQSEHSLSSGSESDAIAFVLVQFATGQTRWGVGVNSSIQIASVNAVLSAINRYY